MSPVLRTHGRSLAVLAVFAALFLNIANVFSLVPAPADRLQPNPLFRVESSDGQPKNYLLSDVTDVVMPWLLHDSREIRDARFPVWNEYEGNGSPHFANPQTAVLSPFSFPIFLFGLRAGLWISTAMKVLCALFGMYGLLILRGRSRSAAVLGAIAFTFSGYMMVWLYWPMAATTALLPVLAYFLIRALDTDRANAGW